jgi:hypothetical protein
VEKTEQAIHISYDTVPHFYMALARSLVMEPGTYPITPEAEQLGLMLDCSRNAVMLPQRIEGLICMMALAGYTYLELYTEDTYELPGEPYFGYKRGRYTVEEIRNIIAFAAIFHIQVIPCIQTLSHLHHLASWEPYKAKMQDGWTLRIGDEGVYELIRKCLRHCKAVFGTDRIHIGMDEAPVGREQYLQHFHRVFQICREEGIQPDFWADAFYLEGQTDAIPAELFDGTQIEVEALFCLRNAVAPTSLLPSLAVEGAHITVDRAQRTNLPGCFAAGDCTGRPYQLAKAVGEGNVAAHSILEYLAEK